MSAAERTQAHASLAERARTLDDIRRIGVNKWLTYAGAHDLPSDPGRCSTEALVQARTALLPSPTPKGGEQPMALKNGKGAPEKKAAPKAPKAPKSWLVQFPTTKPQKAKASLLVGAAPETEEGVTSVTITEPANLEGMPMAALLALANIGNTGTPIRKVTNEQAARTMAWDALVTKVETSAGEPEKAPVKKAVRTLAYTPKDKTEIKQVREGTKVATAINLLSQEGGVLLSEFEAELSKWGKPISGRGWLGYDVNKVVGYGVRSEAEGDDLRIWLVTPKGMKAPLPHKVVEAKAPKAPKPKSEGPKSKKSAVVEEAAPVVEEAAPVVEEAVEAKPKKAAKKAAKK